jgi:hypothetical protein
LPQVGARIAPLIQPPAVVDDPPFRYRRFQWGEGPAVVTEISFGSIIEPVDDPPRFRPFQDTSPWQPGPPAPIVHKKVANTFLHLLVEDNHEPPGGSSPKIVSIDDPPLPQVGPKIAAALYVPPAVDDPPRLKQSQDRTAWQPPPPLPTLSGKLHADVLHVEDVPPVVEPPDGGGGRLAWSGSSFTRDRYNRLRKAIREAEERAEELKRKSQQKVERATDKAEIVADIIDVSEDAIDDRRIDQLIRLLEGVASANSAMEAVKRANEAFLAAKKAIEEAEEEEEAIMLLMSL